LSRTRQIDVHEGPDPGYKKDRVIAAGKRERVRNPWMIDDGNKGWARDNDRNKTPLDESQHIQI